MNGEKSYYLGIILPNQPVHGIQEVLEHIVDVGAGFRRPFAVLHDPHKKSLLTGSFQRGSQKNSEANFFGI